MKMLDRFAPSHSVVHIMAQKPEVVWEKALEGRSWQNLEPVEQLPGDRTNTSHLKACEDLLLSASAILVLAESVGQTVMEGGVSLDLGAEDCSGDDAITSDSACLMCTIIVSDILDAKLGTPSGNPSSDVAKKRPKIICEMLDPRTDRLLKNNDDLHRLGIYFKSNLIETGMFSMAASDPMVFNALQGLMSPGIGDLATVPISVYVSAVAAYGEASPLSFWEVHTLVRWRGDLLVGWLENACEPPQLAPTCHKHEKKL